MITGTDHIAIQANDFAQALNFYHRILGLPVIRDPFDFKTRRVCFLQAGTIAIELYSTKAGEREATAYTGDRGGLHHLCFTVADLDAAVRTVSEAGVTILKQPFRPLTGNSNANRIAFIEGPDSQEIELREMAIRGLP